MIRNKSKQLKSECRGQGSALPLRACFFHAAILSDAYISAV